MGQKSWKEEIAFLRFEYNAIWCRFESRIGGEFEGVLTQVFVLTRKKKKRKGQRCSEGECVSFLYVL